MSIEAAGKESKDNSFDNPPSLHGTSESKDHNPNFSKKFSFLISSSTAVGACGGSGSSSSPPPSSSNGGGVAPSPSPSPTPTSTIADWSEKAAIARFLLRAQFSASLGEIDMLRREGPESWLSRQMKTQNDISGFQFMKNAGWSEVDSQRAFFSETILDPMIWNQLLSGGNSVRKRIAYALSQFFVTSGNRLGIIWPSHAIAAYWDLLNEYAFGNFRDLLERVALSPAIGAFLDSIGNLPDDPATGRKPDENFAREVMQLFTIGLQELNIDGSPKTSFGSPVETYTNEDVAGLARVFTGYNLDASGLTRLPDPNNSTRMVPQAEIVQRPMTSNPANWERPSSISSHSLLEKNFLGVTIPPGTDATTSLRLALDRLFNHPNVGPFFGKQMIQKLVTSNPSSGYITRVAQSFNDNGQGVRGDLAAVFKAILLDPEANAVAGLNDYRFGKLREPIGRFVQFARTFGMNKSDGKWLTRNFSDPASGFGQSPMRSPSVFNFFRPQFTLPASVAAANGMVSPEFQMVSETSVARYLELVPAFVSGSWSWLNDMKPSYVLELELAENSRALLDHLDLILTAGQLRTATRDAILPAMEDVLVISSDEASKLRRIYIAVTLIMSSQDYLVQK